MKKFTLALALIATMLLTGLVIAGDIHHQYGIELRGGLSMYMNMDDPTNWAKQYSSNLDEEMEYAPDFGISLLYKHRNDFVWNIGFNHLFTAKNSFSVGGGDYEETVGASEFFIVPSYIFKPNNTINLSIGIGPTLMLASLDRTGPAGLGGLAEFYGAYGRNMGFLALANLEIGINSKVSLKLGGGYRGCFVDDIDFIEDVDGTEFRRQVVWTVGNVATSRPYELDFSGAFGEVGLRWYIQPKKGW